jgi:DNA repair photolyase
MRVRDNPISPFERYACEWDAAPPPATREIQFEQARSILSQNDSPDIPFRWSLNPYRGCQHGCAYCYARRTHEYLGLGAGTDFETRIVVKENAPALLAAELARPSWRRETIAFSGVTDCYQPLERRFRLTRRCLEVCLDHRTPVGIVTKGALVTRDIDLLRELSRRHGAHVYLSIPFADARAARLIEPHAPPPRLRFAALQALAAAGIPTGVLLAPIIPGLNDRDIPAVLAAAAGAGARTAGFSPVRLPGNVAPVFIERLKQALPEAAGRVEARIRELHDGRLNSPEFGWRMTGQGLYWQSVARLFETMARRHGLRSTDEARAELDPPGAPPPRQLALFDADGASAASRRPVDRCR